MYLIPFAVAGAQKAKDGLGGQQIGGPEALTRTTSSADGMNQADQEEIIRHGGQLTADRLPVRKKP